MINSAFQVETNDDQAIINLMRIYDRWGNQVYANNTEGTIMAWEPELNGEECSQGVYAFYIEITTGDGVLETRHGTLTVIK